MLFRSLAGHEHNYQRFAPQTHFTMGTPLANTQVQDDQTYGVLKLTLYSTS